MWNISRVPHIIIFFLEMNDWKFAHKNEEGESIFEGGFYYLIWFIIHGNLLTEIEEKLQIFCHAF